ncbi:universal stress protein [Halopenitus persicus]|jgi:nucleotide-binding universal stress UspA family protein|uniref:Nucleotide-binding universal stress protein, UspA family n=1 Tax=Halopenitus persicus TaxID=1048396 RepID=A0A1H3E879_9EURY|nr:universal stress protein [Halopenitus persicus]SDX74972.1 Nucleotide-binding universal stress protein, UspA family [Halopenitus persicus]
MFDHILFPTDGTERTDAVLEYALDMAETRDATLHVLSVVDDRSFLTLDDDRVDEVRSDLEAQARSAVDAAVDAAADRGIPTTSAVDVGDPSPAIIEYVEEAGIDLVVMGTSGDNYERNIVGSVSQRVVKQSPVPVLTVRIEE